YQNIDLHPSQIQRAYQLMQNKWDRLYLAVQRQTQTKNKVENNVSRLSELCHFFKNFSNSIQLETLQDDLITLATNFSGLFDQNNQIKEDTLDKIKQFCNLLASHDPEKSIEHFLLYGSIYHQLFLKPKIKQKPLDLSDSGL